MGFVLIKTSDSLAFLKELDQYSNDIIYCDPPYALGSEVIIRADGKVDYKNASDFMNKWEMPTGTYWEAWFKEAYRTLKYGGYLIMFGMDRQLLLFKYYAQLSGFQEQQSLYWYFISNFPKATDLSKMIDKNNGRKKEDYLELGKYLKERRGKKPQKDISKFFPSKTGGMTGCVANWELGLNVPTMQQWEILKRELKLDNKFDWLIEREEAEREITREAKKEHFSNDLNGFDQRSSDERERRDIPSSDLAKKYDGYKYSISPLKQTNETIMVFKKPTKTGSVLHDTLAYENGDETITVGALNIDGNRVGTEKIMNGSGELGKNNIYGSLDRNKESLIEVDGRYPSQTFIDSQVAEVLDKQSGIQKGETGRAGRSDLGTKSNYWGVEAQSPDGANDYGGCSRILHTCDYEQEDFDLYHYEPKVSSSERNAGCDGMEEKQYSHDGREKPIENPYQRNESVARNTHPTLKPIALNEKILKLFKTPNNQRICYAFAGAGSEIIGGIKAGFDNWIGCEISQEYVDIANARIEYWKETMTTQIDIFEVLGL